MTCRVSGSSVLAISAMPEAMQATCLGPSPAWRWTESTSDGCSGTRQPMSPGRCRSPPCVGDTRRVPDGRDHAGGATGTGRRVDRGAPPRHHRRVLIMAVLEDIRPLGAGLERSYLVYVRGRLKFRVRQIVYVSFSLDESVMGFAFPKEERAALVASEPHKFQMPSASSDMRFNWVHADLAALDPTEVRELVVDAWRMVVPKKLSRAYDLIHPNGPG